MWGGCRRGRIIKCHQFDTTWGSGAIFVLDSLVAAGQVDVCVVYWQVFLLWHCLAGSFSKKEEDLSSFSKKIIVLYLQKCKLETDGVYNCRQWLVKNEGNCRLIEEPPYLHLHHHCLLSAPLPPLSSTPLPISSEAIMDVVCHVSLSADWISASACVNTCVCVREWSSYRLLVQ